MDNLIKIYDKAIPKEVCDSIINEFEVSKNQMEGMSGAGVNKSIKASTDLMIHSNLDNPNWSYIYDYLRENLLGNLVDYIQNNSYMTITAGFASKASAVRTAQSCYIAGNNGFPHMQMQRYIDDQGYYAWHHENEGGTTARRELFFIYYLNDVDGGETEFKFNGEKVKPEAGKLVIAPALWTHKHRGNPPQNGQNKYIITGWIEKIDDHDISSEFEEDYLM
jgi:hypothetical protein